MHKRPFSAFAASFGSLLLLAVTITSDGTGAVSAGTVVVSTSNDSGPGSFRDAIATANTDDSITRILCVPSVSTIDLQGTIFFTGSQDLVIEGNNVTLDGTNAGVQADEAGGGNGTLT
jgi:hypothetical protein